MIGVIWLVIFLIRKDLRQEMLFGSFLGLPFGFIEYFFVPSYWNPLSLFDFIRRFGFGIESFIFAFFTAGIAAVFYEFLGNKKTVKIKQGRKNNILLYAVFVATFIILEFIFPSRAVYNLAAAFAIAACAVALQRRDLVPQMITSAFMFGALYLLMFALMEAIYPGVVSMFYNLHNLLGIFILGVPLEEIIIAFIGGACWSVLYEYVNGYRVRNR